MTIIFCLLIFISFLMKVNSSQSESSSILSSNCTIYEQPFNSLIQRRKRRGIIFPSGSSILVTHAITKVMNGGTPRGLSISYELDIYFPLPSTLEGLYPNTKLNNKLKSRSSVDFFHKEFKNFTRNTLSVTKKNNNFTQTYFKNVLLKKLLNTNNHEASSESQDYANSKNYHFHRQRKDIFNKLESVGSIMGLTMKYCIMRTICEATHYLLPPEKSLIQDLIRILFTFAINDIHNNGDYQKDTKVINEDCHSVYKTTCPISMMDLILHGDNTRFM